MEKEMDIVQYSSDLFEKFQQNKNYDYPFPMGVFGTLRKGHNNSRLMGRNYFSHRYAFLPHFYARGLGVYHNQGSSGVFEIFSYSEEEFQRMIPSVDSLEGFSPKRGGSHHYYIRTLAKLKLLPEDFTHHFIEDNSLQQIRDFKIPEEEWKNYPDVYCWIYSNETANKSSLNAGNTPVVWSS